MVNIDDFVKVVLVLSVCFSLVGISIQIIRMLGGFVETVKFANKIAESASTIVEKFTGDYDYIMEQVKMIVDIISKFVNTVLGPVTKLFGFMKGFSGKMPGADKTKKDKSGKDEDEE